MAFAKAPAYGKPKKQVKKVSATAPSKGYSPGYGTPKKQVAKKPAAKAPVSAIARAPSAAPVAANVAAIPQITAGAPVATAGATADRIKARQGYTNTQAEINDRIRKAGQAYGGAGQVTQFQYGDDGKDVTTTAAGIVDDPLSATALAARNYGETSRARALNGNAENTLFGSNQLRDQQGFVDERGRTIEEARRQYEQAVQDLTNQLIAARGGRDESLAAADEADRQAALAKEAEAQAERDRVAQEQAAAAAAAGGGGGAWTPQDHPDFAAQWSAGLKGQVAQQVRQAQERARYEEAQRRARAQSASAAAAARARAGGR